MSPKSARMPQHYFTDGESKICLYIGTNDKPETASRKLKCKKWLNRNWSGIEPIFPEAKAKIDRDAVMVGTKLPQLAVVLLPVLEFEILYRKRPNGKSKKNIRQSTKSSTGPQYQEKWLMDQFGSNVIHGDNGETGDAATQLFFTLIKTVWQPPSWGYLPSVLDSWLFWWWDDANPTTDTATNGISTKLGRYRARPTSNANSSSEWCPELPSYDMYVASQRRPFI